MTALLSIVRNNLQLHNTSGSWQAHQHHADTSHGHHMSSFLRSQSQDQAESRLLFIASTPTRTHQMY